MIHLKKHILTLVALIALTTQALAEDPSESFTTTGDQVEFTGEHFIITGTENFEGLGFNVDNGRTITIASMNNEIITRVMLTFDDGYKYFGHGTADHGTIEYTYQDSREGVASIKDVNSTTLTIGCEISGFYCFTQICQITVYYTTAPAVTFVPVSGKTNEWTIKDGMPAGNVIVNAEYYQDAAFAMSTGTTPVALAPTANNSAKANTDDPLVTGGEVANIVEGTEALEAKQGTLMYYFDRDKATTKMTAAQLEELTADKWSDKVPTADGLHFDAATNVFVYYYIKGADDVTGLADGVKHTFSDSDPVCLTVSVQKEPTFKVELNAEGLTTAEAANWKAAKGSATPAAFPLTGVKKDDNVTVTYTGSRKVIGVKAEKKFKLAAEATTADKGKLICTDGHIHDYGKDAECTAARVAKIVYIGATNVYTYDHGLALALADEGQMSSGDASTACGIDKNSSTPIKDALWFLPSKDYWDLLLGANGAGSYTALRDGFESVGGTNMLSAEYLSSSLDDDKPTDVWIFDFSNGNWKTIQDHSFKFRACLIF